MNARTPVTSSNLVSVGYDGTSHVLEVEFRGGRVYHYRGVHPDDYQALMSAESIGGHFAAFIKPRYVGVPYAPAPKKG